MNTSNSLARQLTSMLSGVGFPPPPIVAPSMALGPQEDHVCDGPDPFDLLQVAVLVKYGGTLREACAKFVAESTEICKAVFSDVEKPTFQDKLDALKETVAEETFNRLLANPDVERMASRAYTRKRNTRRQEALAKLTAMFNGAICPEMMDYIMSELAEEDDPVTAIAG